MKMRAEWLRKILRDTQEREVVQMVFELSWKTIDEDEILSGRDEELTIVCEPNAILTTGQRRNSSHSAIATHQREGIK